MQNRWNERDLQALVRRHAPQLDANRASCIYAARLLGADPGLVLHGGGNVSAKAALKTMIGETVESLFVKASGTDLASIEPDGFVELDQVFLKKCLTLESLSDEAMDEVFTLHRLKPSVRQASVETLLHACMPAAFVVHTHPAAVLALTNREDGEKKVAEAFGKDMPVVPYYKAGFALAKACAQALAVNPAAQVLVLMQHGLVTVAASASEAYRLTIDTVTKAEQFLDGKRQRPARPSAPAPTVGVEQARRRYREFAPLIRGLLSPPTGSPDRPFSPIVLRHLVDDDILTLLESSEGRRLAATAPLTPDYLIRTKAFPLIVYDLSWDDPKAVRERIAHASNDYSTRYRTYAEQYGSRTKQTIAVTDALPKVLMLPGLGVVCAGADYQAASIAYDITEQALKTKQLIRETGGRYKGLDEKHLADMEFYNFQRNKVDAKKRGSLHGAIAIVTGSAGAIGSGICELLLREGCHVAATDLGGKRLDAFVAGLRETYGDRVAGVALDVTDPDSVASGFGAVTALWGGVDFVIINAGLAHVQPLSEMDLVAFTKLSHVNIDGALHLLRESGRLFRVQGIGGDIVLVSTKNVFSPGATFGAYSATKAAAHQLARIASLELAGIGVRVNMVAPDAVFGHGQTRSGLWATVGPDRMKARGLDEKGLEEYYRSRNLLKAQVTAEHVANAALFFLLRQTPTTGATIPVDGGLPDATPR